MFKTFAAFLQIFLVGGVLTGCVPQVDNHGKGIDSEDLKKIKPHMHTREDVRRLLGSPSLVDRFSPDTWFYLYRITSSTAFFTPEEKELKIIAVIFHKNGMVKDVKVSGEKGTQSIPVVGRETPTKGKETGYLEQIFGNFGRIHRGNVKSE